MFEEFSRREVCVIYARRVTRLNRIFWDMFVEKHFVYVYVYVNVFNSSKFIQT